MLGSHVTTIAYPLLVLRLTGSPFEAGWVAFAATAPSILVHMPARALVDRWDPRQAMLMSEIDRGIAIAAVGSPRGFLYARRASLRRLARGTRAGLASANPHRGQDSRHALGGASARWPAVRDQANLAVPRPDLSTTAWIGQRQRLFRTVPSRLDSPSLDSPGSARPRSSRATACHPRLAGDASRSVIAAPCCRSGRRGGPRAPELSLAGPRRRRLGLSVAGRGRADRGARSGRTPGRARMVPF